MSSVHQKREMERSSSQVNHASDNPNGSRAHEHWANEQILHVAAMYSNPCRWQTRRNLFNDFRRHIESLPNVRLYVGELAYGDRPFEVTSARHEFDFQWRTRDILWHKENVLNEVIRRFEPNWEYGAYIDGDFTFTRQDIALETIHQLQQYEWVHMFGTYCDLSHDHQPMRVLKSFGARYAAGELSQKILDYYAGKPDYYGNGKPKVVARTAGVGATGAAWAFRRDSFTACGGLLDTCILGSGDWHMAFGLACEPDCHPQTAELNGCAELYTDSIRVWQNRASLAVRQNIGFVDCHAIHHWHGSKQRRGYGTRWKILGKHSFNPYADLFRDHHGIYQLTLEKPGLRDDIRRYFNSRTEDDRQLYSDDAFMV